MMSFQFGTEGIGIGNGGFVCQASSSSSRNSFFNYSNNKSIGPSSTLRSTSNRSLWKRAQEVVRVAACSGPRPTRVTSLRGAFPKLNRMFDFTSSTASIEIPPPPFYEKNGTHKRARMMEEEKDLPHISLREEWGMDIVRVLFPQEDDSDSGGGEDDEDEDDDFSLCTPCLSFSSDEMHYEAESEEEDFESEAPFGNCLGELETELAAAARSKDCGGHGRSVDWGAILEI